MAPRSSGYAAFVWSGIGLALILVGIYISPIAVLSAVGGVVVLAASPAREKITDMLGNGIWAVFGAIARLRLPGRRDPTR